MKRRAVFLDRDGTLVHARHYPSEPRELALYSGLAEELAALSAAGFALVVITNQSGIARGHFTIDALDRMHVYLRSELASAGVHLDAIYHCPHHPDGTISNYAIDCTCRKPQPGMLVQAAQDLDLDLRGSWLVGDILDDIEAGNSAGCRTVLIDLGTERQPDDPIRVPDFVARTTVDAVRLILSIEGRDIPADPHYLPPSWRERTAVPTGARADLAGFGANSSSGGVRDVS